MSDIVLNLPLISIIDLPHPFITPSLGQLISSNSNTKLFTSNLHTRLIYTHPV